MLFPRLFGDWEGSKWWNLCFFFPSIYLPIEKQINLVFIFVFSFWNRVLHHGDQPKAVRLANDNNLKPSSRHPSKALYSAPCHSSTRIQPILVTLPRRDYCSVCEYPIVLNPYIYFDSPLVVAVSLESVVFHLALLFACEALKTSYFAASSQNCSISPLSLVNCARRSDHRDFRIEQVSSFGKKIPVAFSSWLSVFEVLPIIRMLAVISMTEV